MEHVKHLFRRLFDLLMHPFALVGVTLLGIAAAYNAENAFLTTPFAVSIAAVLAALLFLLSRRLAFSIYVAWMIICIETIVSAIKYKMRGFSFHFYDAVFVATDKEIYSFLFGSYLYLILPVLIAFALCIAFGVALFRMDSRSPRSMSSRFAVFGTAIVLMPLTFPAEASHERHLYYLRGRHISAFFVSLLDLQNYFTQTDFQKRLAAMPPQEPFADEVDCGDLANQPDVFVVLAETGANLADFPQIAGEGDFIHRYSPHVGSVHPLGVEVFGAGTWISNLSLLTGLSSTDFGWRSPYLTITLKDRIRGSLPEVFKRCGYRTATIMPLEYSSANEGPFLNSIGFEDVYDYKAIGAPTYHMRDDVYFAAAEKLIAEHHETDKRPLFLAIQTMFAHSGYEERLEPSVTVPGEPFNADPELAEYARRLAIARGDLDAFLQKRKTSDRGSVVLEFGDHQPYVTKPFIDAAEGPDALADKNSFAYQTYYTVTAFNHALNEGAAPQGRTDIGYLGATFLDMAGLPSSPVMRDLVRLRDACKGKFYLCADRDAVDVHLKRRIDGGMLDIIDDSQSAPAS